MAVSVSINWYKFISRILLVSLLVVSLYYGLTYSLSLLSKPSPGIHYATQRIIHNTVRITAQPVWHPKKNQLHFNVTCESTQNPSFLATPLDQLTYLKISNMDHYKPITWTHTTKKPNHNQGQLIFSVETPTLPSQFDLVFYITSPVTLSWTTTQ